MRDFLFAKIVSIRCAVYLHRFADTRIRRPRCNYSFIFGRPARIQSNPVSVAEGKRLYGATDCALCHGKDGGGKGVLAKDISMNLHDWRKPESLAHFTDGELSYLILKGKGRMPAYDGRETSEQVWGMINYVRSMSASGDLPKS